MDGIALPVTIAGRVIVIGPCPDAEDKHAELVRRTMQWHDSPGWISAAGEITGMSRQPTRSAIRRATDHLQRSAHENAAIVHPRNGQIRYLSLPGPGRRRWTGIRSLADVSAASLDDESVRADAVARLTSPCTGLFAPVRADPLPADGVATARLQVIGSTQRHSVGWAEDPGTALTHALLAGVRILSTQSAPAASGGRVLVGASGISELHWLLDGALRLLSTYSIGPEGRLSADDILDVASYRVPHLGGDWRIARASSTSSGAPIAAAWGHSAPAAIRNVVTAARAQRSTTAAGTADDAGSPSTDAMLHSLTPTDLRRLRHDVQQCLRRLRFRALGARLAADPLLGDPGLACGIVWKA